MSSQNAIRRKLVIVGDGACGKTSLLCSFALGEFPKEYQPTVFDNYVAEIRLDDKPVQLALWDTAGQEEYERLRPMSYSKSHVILIAFSLDTPDSLENVTTKWIEEVRSICGSTIPVILVGCKADLRPSAHHPNTSDNPCPWVTREQGERVAQIIGARAYKECSALKIEGVDEVFEAATRASMLMRDGVPANGHVHTPEARHHRRRSSGRAGPQAEEPSNGWKCCVIS
ncbi:Small GTPase [Pleurotus pulmonarius]